MQGFQKAVVDVRPIVSHSFNGRLPFVAAVPISGRSTSTTSVPGKIPDFEKVSTKHASAKDMTPIILGMLIVKRS
jgi:hypothetical protein